MDAPGFQLLNAGRLTRVVRALQDIRDLPAQLKFLARTAIVPATDDELTIRMLDYALIADIIADGQAARTVNYQRFATTTNVLPNIKIGTSYTQADINRLNAFLFNGPTVEYDREGLLTDFYRKKARKLLLGVEQRSESLRVAMAIGAFNYNGYGIVLNGVKFGRPSDLNITPSTFWDNPAATPVSDILNAKLLASIRYGKDYNRMTLSRQAFQYLIANADFITRVRVEYGINATVSGTALNLENVDGWLKRAAVVLGLDEIEVYDSRYWIQNEDASVTANRFMGVNYVVLSSTMDDNQEEVQDIGNAITTESIVAGIAPNNAIGNLPRGTYGPISYATVQPELNPPDLKQWAVAKRWPRLWDQAAECCLNVGTFTDTIATGVNFPNFS